jgi:hypothetical protein
MELPRGRGDVQSILMDGYEIAQLLELHRAADLIVAWVLISIGYKFKQARAAAAPSSRHH